MIETALAPYKVGINGITIPILIPLLRCFFAARCALYDEKKSFPGFLRGKDFLCFYPNGRRALAGIPDLRNFGQPKTQNSKEIIMEFNYGLERKRFEREWNKLRQQYRKAGMDENAINEMYAFDLEIFNDNRAIAKHEQPITPDMSGDNEDKSTLFEKFMDQLSYQDSYVFIPQRYAWLDQIRNNRLYESLLGLRPDDIELITLYVFERYTYEEIGKKFGISKQAVNQRVNRLKRQLRCA